MSRRAPARTVIAVPAAGDRCVFGIGPADRLQYGVMARSRCLPPDPATRASHRWPGREWAVLFDWGDTVMRVFPGSVGPMAGWPRVEAVPGVRQALAALRPHAVLGLATNAADSYAEEIRAALRRVRLSSYFEKVFCYRSLGVRKPSRRYFAAVLADLGLPSERVVMVGDEWHADVEGALSAGLRAVWYDPSRRGECRHERVRTLHEMSALPRILREWGVT